MHAYTLSGAQQVVGCQQVVQAVCPCKRSQQATKVLVGASLRLCCSPRMRGRGRECLPSPVNRYRILLGQGIKEARPLLHRAQWHGLQVTWGPRKESKLGLFGMIPATTSRENVQSFVCLTSSRLTRTKLAPSRAIVMPRRIVPSLQVHRDSRGQGCCPL